MGSGWNPQASVMLTDLCDPAKATAYTTIRHHGELTSPNIEEVSDIE